MAQRLGVAERGTGREQLGIARQRHSGVRRGVVTALMRVEQQGEGSAVFRAAGHGEA